MTLNNSCRDNLILFCQGNTNVDISEALEAMLKDQARSAAAKSAKAASYEKLWEIVSAHMSSAPMTVAEIHTACESELPEGETKGKIQYALNNLWTDRVVKIQQGHGFPNTYRLA